MEIFFKKNAKVWAPFKDDLLVAKTHGDERKP